MQESGRCVSTVGISRRWLLKGNQFAVGPCPLFPPSFATPRLATEAGSSFRLLFSQPSSHCRMQIVPSTIISSPLPPVSNCRLAASRVSQLDSTTSSNSCVCCTSVEDLLENVLHLVLPRIGNEHDSFSIVEQRNRVYLLFT